MQNYSASAKGKEKGVSDQGFRESPEQDQGVVRAGDGTVALLAGSVPNLSLDDSAVRFDAFGRKLYSNGRLGL